MRALLKIGALVVSTAACFALAEYVYRLVGARVTEQNLHLRYRQYFEDAERSEIANMAAGAERGLLVDVEGSPRPRKTFKPGSTIYICYSGVRRDYFDDRGCVRMDFNSRGIRDREELCQPKPPGQKRIVCLGDSFTIGWGVRAEDSWTHLVEQSLRERDDGIRTVNCGAAGTLYVDEYWWGLRDRFHVFEPDAVLLTICLNDVLPTSTALCHYSPEGSMSVLWRSHLLRDLFGLHAMQHRMTFGPGDPDPVEQLLGLTEEQFDVLAEAIPWWKLAGYRTFWSGGGSQEALLAARDWCLERDVKFGVVVWPYFQGLGADEFYPFGRMHELIGLFCGENGIPFLDLLPALRDHDAETLWVSPADMHGNEIAHRVAAPVIAEFVARFTGWQ